MCVLIVDDFGIKYFGDQHVQHLQKVFQEHYEITTDWEGEKFAGINIEWSYAKKHSKRSCRRCTKNYISNILIKHDHPMPLKPQLSPHKHREIQYGAKVQTALYVDTSPPLDAKGIKRVQQIVGSLLYYERAVDNRSEDLRVRS